MKKSLKASILISLSFILVAILSFTGVYSYFSAQAGNTATVKVGSLYINLKDGSATIQSLTNITDLVPGKYLLGSASEFKNLTIDMSETSVNSFLRVKVDASLGSFESSNVYDIELGSGWYKHTDGYYYQLSIANDTSSDVKEVAGKANQSLPIKLRMKPEIGGLANSEDYMNVSGTYSITVEAIQADYVEVDNPNATYSVSELAVLWPTVVANS